MTTASSVSAGPPPQASDEPVPAVGGERAEARPYDFRRPNQFGRDHVRALQIVSESFARGFTSTLSTTLRAVSQVQLASIDQLAYGDHVKALPNPTLLALVSLDPLPGAAMLHLPLPIAMSAIDRFLGGSGSGSYPNRPLTDIESGLIRGLITRALQELAGSFESLVPIEPAIVQLESNPQFAQIAAPSDMVVIETFDIRIGSHDDRMSMCVPAASLQPVLERVAGQSLFADRGGAVDRTATARALGDRIADVPVEVSVCFAPVALTSAEIVSLQAGDVLPLHHPVGDPLTLSADGVRCLAAVPGRKGKRLACVVVDSEIERKP